MPRTNISKLTPEILRGANAFGLNSKSIKSLLGLSANQFESMSAGKSLLTAQQIALIEEKASRNVGELAVAGMQLSKSTKPTANSKMLTETAKVMAMFNESKPSSANVRRKMLARKAG